MNDMISIIVPIYNVSLYLKECIDSILNQTYQNIEIILVDDGSTDCSGEICDSYAEVDSRVVVIHKKNAGLVRARKDGVHKASGDYIGFVDGDDWVEPDMFGSLYDCIKRNHADVTMCGRYEDFGHYRKEVHQNVPSGNYSREEMKSRIFPRMIAGGEFFTWGMSPCIWDKLFRADLLRKHLYNVEDEIQIGEDAACTFPLMLDVNRLTVIENCFYHYRQNPNSMTKSEIKDANLERGRFYSLYSSVKKIFEEKKDIYDFTHQWLMFVLFLMIPRADFLCSDFYEDDYLFPYPKVKRGEKIILYGMGLYGQRLYYAMKKSGFCNVVATVDINYKSMNLPGIIIESPEVVKHREFDHMIICISFADPRQKAFEYLCNICNKEKIVVIDRDFVQSTYILHKFGLEN